jgi:hypothetical protein
MKQDRTEGYGAGKAQAVQDMQDRMKAEGCKFTALTSEDLKAELESLQKQQDEQ